MNDIQTTYIVVCWNGDNKLITAYSYSDAYEQAADFASDKGGIQTFGER